MSIGPGPIYARVTSRSQSTALLAHLTATSNDLFISQQQLSTGKRILTTSMDALGSVEYLRYSSRGTRNDVYLDTVVDLSSGYNYIDGQMSQALDVTTSLKQIALRESNDGASDAETRSQAATTVSNLRSALLALANAKLKGSSIFGGKNTQGTAFSSFGDALLYNGTRDVNTRFIDDGLAFEQSLSAERVFGELQTVSASRVDLNAIAGLGTVSPPGSALVSTPLAALNGGRGVDLDVMKVAILPDGSGDPSSGISYEVDLRGAKNIADVIEAFNAVEDADGNSVFSATVYQSAGLSYPTSDATRITGIRIEATGSLSTAVNGKPATIQFVDKPGRSTARDLGLVTGQISYTFQSASLATAFPTPDAAGTFNQTYNFDLKVNGQSFAMSVDPSGAESITELATAMQTEVRSALSQGGLSDFSVSVSAVDTDDDGLSDALEFDVEDGAGTGSFEIVASGASTQSVSIADAIASASVTQAASFDAGLGSFAGGVFGGRDLDPALTINTSVTALRGGNGFQLAKTDVGGAPTTIKPQGLTITNGVLSADIDLSSILADQNRTVGDIINAINGSGIQVEARIAATGDRIEIASKLIGVPLRIDNLNGSIATQLGVDTRFSEMRTRDLNDGRGLNLSDGDDFKAVTSTGQTVLFDLGAPATVQGVVDAINRASGNVQPNGDPAFTAKAVTERNFSSTAIAAGTLSAASSFQVSLNGLPARTLSVNTAGAALTLDELAEEFSTALDTLASELGLSGMSVRVHADNGTGGLNFQIQDENGPASIDFIGGATSQFGLDGSVNGQGVRTLENESVSHRFVLEDNTFTAASYTPGQAAPVLQNLGTSSVLNDLGLMTSDATRIQYVGAAPATGFDPAAAINLTLDLPRGPQLAIAVAASAGRTMSTLAVALESAIRTEIAAQNIEGFGVRVTHDTNTGGLIVEVTDGFGDASLTIGGADAANLGVDSAQIESEAPVSVMFNSATSSFEGSAHAPRGEAADNIFTTINDLIAALQADSTVSVAATVTDIETSLSRFLDARNETGSRVRRLDLAKNRLEAENDHLRELTSRVMDADLAATATTMARQQALFEAGIQSTARILRVSVLDYL